MTAASLPLPAVPGGTPPGVTALYDPDVFEGLDLNQDTGWLDADGVRHRIGAMLVTERLDAAAELERLGSAVEWGEELVRASILHRALLDLEPPAESPAETPAETEAGIPSVGERVA
ncbi:hypothetical protein [Microlunatus ginsengisoli]|uniref:hypothetical protein n=1 Tax=Microlunatus ginsengisoli TaxID=363863 RepID=UPI0031D82887